MEDPTLVFCRACLSHIFVSVFRKDPCSFYHSVLKMVTSVVRSVYLSKLIKPVIGGSVNHVTSRSLSTSQIIHRAAGGSPEDALTKEYDAIIIGAGHNGLTAVSCSLTLSLPNCLDINYGW